MESKREKAARNAVGKKGDVGTLEHLGCGTAFFGGKGGDVKCRNVDHGFSWNAAITRSGTFPGKEGGKQTIRNRNLEKKKEGRES